MSFEEKIVTLDTPVDFSRQDGTSRSVRSKSEVEVYDKRNAVSVRSKNENNGFEVEGNNGAFERKSNAIVYSIRKDRDIQEREPIDDRSYSPRRRSPLSPSKKRQSRSKRITPVERHHDSDYEYEQERLRRLRYPDLGPIIYPLLKGLETSTYYPPVVQNVHSGPAMPTQIHVQPSHELPALPPPPPPPVQHHYQSNQSNCCSQHSTQHYTPTTTTPHGNFQRVSAEQQYSQPVSIYNPPPPPVLQSSYDFNKKPPPPYYFDSINNHIPLAYKKQPKESTEKIPSYLFLSIVACILCPICGIIALCFSNESRAHYKAREFNTAYTSGLRAKSFAYCGIFTNLVTIVLIAIIAGVTVGVLKALNKI